MRLHNKSVVVTGASSGMGKAIVETFVREGAYVIAVARRREKLDELAAGLEGAAGKVIPFAGDVSKREVNEDMIDLAVKEFGKLDILVNNAGTMDDMGPIGDVDDDKYEQIMRVNTYGPMCAMRKAVNVFMAQGDGGNIINIASVGAFRTCAGVIYMASKAAIVAMTKNTAFMYTQSGIRANAIAPGAIATNIGESMGTPNMFGYSRVKGVIATAPPPGSAEQIASAALFLASDESSYINGDVLVVDGGWTAG